MWEFIESVIATEVEHQKIQSDYFMKRVKAGNTVRPKVYQPNVEPEGSGLVAIFVEPGAAHLVFRDEIAPQEELDERYREARKIIFGRTHDVESVEFLDGHVKFVNNSSLFNIYEASFHWNSVDTFRGSVFSDTWNHMLSAGGKWVNMIRGGYRLALAQYIEGDREAAEKWSV